MALVLLDHPWPLTEALNPSNDAFDVLLSFDRLIKRLIKQGKCISPVPFVDSQQYQEFWAEVEGDDSLRLTGPRFLTQIAAYLRSDADRGGSTACPEPEPTGPPLPPTWKKALRESMGDPRDWRNPQIVVATKRADSWSRRVPRPLEIEIKIDGNYAGECVLASLEGYESHPFALSDFDPWDLQRCHQTAAGGRLATYLCCLPKHPALNGVPLEQLPMKLEQLRRQGWQYRVGEGDRYCYIPSDGWDPTLSEKDDWRNGRTFPQSEAGGHRGRGPVDYDGRVWRWDLQEGKRHWDVQFPVKNPEDNPRYWVISHTGELLRKP